MSVGQRMLWKIMLLYSFCNLDFSNDSMSSKIFLSIHGAPPHSFSLSLIMSFLSFMILNDSNRSGGGGLG